MIDVNSVTYFFMSPKPVDMLFHRDYCGIEIYTKWFENGRMLKPEFRTIARTHTVSRSQLTLLLAGAVQAPLKIERAPQDQS